MTFKFPLILLSIFALISYNNKTFAAKKKFVVVIDAGHGGKDPGTIGSRTKEKDISLKIAKKLGALIEKNNKDVSIIYTRTEDVFVELHKRAEIANKANANLFISLHCNSAPKNKNYPQGLETYILGIHRSKDNLEIAKAENSVILFEDDYKAKYQGFDPQKTESYIIFDFLANNSLNQSLKIASYIQDRIPYSSSITNRGVKQAGFLVLRETIMPSILVELGYLSNKKEEDYLNSNQGQNYISSLICSAFTKYKEEYENKNEIKRDNIETVENNSDSIDTIDKNRDNTKIVDKNIDNSETEYRIQILMSDKKYNSNSNTFKGLKPITYYVEGNLYKYTYGHSTNKKEIDKLLKVVKKKYKDAFIVKIKKGNRLK